MSRKATKKLYRWNDAEPILAAKGITVISAGLDEVPTAYKDIEEVMDGQDDMVGILARFTPKLIKMWRHYSALTTIIPWPTHPTR